MNNSNEAPMYFLALQKMPGDYKLIDISKLSISNGYNTTSLMELDTFAMAFSTEQILESIRDVNIVGPEYLNGKLVIQDNQRHKPLVVITKDYLNGFNLEDFLKSIINNKERMNNIAYKLSTLVDDEIFVAGFKMGVKTKDVDVLQKVIFNISYLIQRKFVLYLIELYSKDLEKNKNKELIRDKAA